MLHIPLRSSFTKEFYHNWDSLQVVEPFPYSHWVKPICSVLSPLELALFKVGLISTHKWRRMNGEWSIQECLALEILKSTEILGKSSENPGKILRKSWECMFSYLFQSKSWIKPAGRLPHPAVSAAHGQNPRARGLPAAGRQSKVGIRGI